MYENIRVPPLGVKQGVKRSKHFFSQGGHVAYQIKGNEAYIVKCTCIQAISLPLYTPSTPWVGCRGQKVKTIVSVMLHIK